MAQNPLQNLALAATVARPTKIACDATTGAVVTSMATRLALGSLAGAADHHDSTGMAVRSISTPWGWSGVAYRLYE